MRTNYPTIPDSRADDLHNLDLAGEADLVLFMAGNQFMVMAELVAAFQGAYPEIEKIFYETLPPGLELRQILAGGAMFQGRLLSARADVYSAVSREAMQTLVKNGLTGPEEYFPYLHNRLCLMVPAGNPAAIATVADLGRDRVRVSQPDPRHEDIGRHVIEMYYQAGGRELVDRIMVQKQAAGTTIFTTVHHRETPARIREKSVDVGPVWATEALHAQRAGLAFERVEPGQDLDQRHRVNYYICGLKNGGNPENGKKFLNFIRSAPAQGIYEQHGFVPEPG